jgi:hypothetical protein
MWTGQEEDSNKKVLTLLTVAMPRPDTGATALDLVERAIELVENAEDEAVRIEKNQRTPRLRKSHWSLSEALLPLPR